MSKRLENYIRESQDWIDTPVPGDDFAINIREECLVESYIVDTVEDGVVLAADERMIGILESYGLLGDITEGFDPDSWEDEVEVEWIGDDGEEVAGMMSYRATVDPDTGKITTEPTGGYVTGNNMIAKVSPELINDLLADEDYSREYQELAQQDADAKWADRDADSHNAHDINDSTAMEARDGPSHSQERELVKRGILPSGDEVAGMRKQLGRAGRLSARQMRSLEKGKYPGGPNEREYANLMHSDDPAPMEENLDKDSGDLDRLRHLANIPHKKQHEDSKMDEQQLDEFLPALGAMAGRALVGAEAGALARGAAGLAGRAVGTVASNVLSNDDDIDEAEYQGRKVPLAKPMKGDVAKSKVYVKGPKGNVVKVNFGDKTMRIKKSNPKRRKSFRARHNCANPGPRWKARYWSCRAW